MKHWILAALLLPACAASPPPEEPAPPPPPVAESKEDILFTLSAGKIFLDIMINGKGPYPFAMDTGSPPTVIDIGLARDLGLNVARGGRIGGAGEGTSEMGIVQGIALSFGGINLPARPMPAVDLNERLAPFGSRPIMGLLGNDFITSRVVTIDYANQRLRIRDPKGWTYDGDGTIIPTRTRGYTFIDGKIKLAEDAPGNGEELPVRFLIDTGAGLALSLTTPFVSKHDLITQAGAKFKASVGWGLGGEVRHEVCRLDFVELGGVRIDKPICALSQDKAGALASRQFDGIVGGEILSRYTVTLDGPHRRMILEPNERASRPIEFDMSGLALGGDAGRGPLKVLRVRDDSPAHAAGIKEGDIVLSVDGHPVTGKDRDLVKESFRLHGEERTLELDRHGEKLTVTFKLRRMVRAGFYGQPAA